MMMTQLMLMTRKAMAMVKPTKEQLEYIKALNKLERQFEKELIYNYQQALKELRARIAFIYEKYDGNWIEMQRYNRLTKLEKEIGQEIAKLTGKNAQTLKRGMMDSFEESYYRTVWSMTNQIQADLGFVMLSKEIVEKSIQNPLDRVGFLQRNRDNQARLTRQLRENLTQSLMLGEAYGTAAKRIKGRMDVGATNVLRIARTEMHRTKQQARQDSIKEGAEKGLVLKKHWLATIDGRTRDAHGSLDGVQVNPDEQFEIDGYTADGPGLFGVPELDIHCRCDLLEVVDGWQPDYRRIKGIGVVKYVTYEEFLETGLKYTKVAN